MGAPTRNMRQIWGGAPIVDSEELLAAVEDLQADLQALVQDLRRGPIAALREQIDDYLAELRRELLRPHRRLQVLLRDDDGRREAHEALRRELAELATRFRTVVLTRSSRITHGAWHPAGLVDAVQTAVGSLPRVIEAPYEARTFAAQPDDGLLHGTRRSLLRVGRWLRKSTGGAPGQRQVELRELARYHLEGKACSQIEGLAALILQSESQLSGRSRHVIELAVQGLDALVAHAEQPDFSDMLDGLRVRFEDELESIERDSYEILDECIRRAEKLFGEALQVLKEELPVVATIDLPSGQRKAGFVAAATGRTIAELEARIATLRQQVSGSYVQLAMDLEFVSFRSRLQQTMDGVLNELRADVRGRSRVQLERVRGAIDEVLTELADSGRAKRGSEDGEIRGLVQPLEFIVDEAAGVTRRLLDQLSADASVAPLLETLNREAQGLTDRYRVPVGVLPRAEWKLPAPVSMTEIEFSAVVASFVQREIAPEVLAISHRAMNRVLPILDVFSDLERVVSFNAGSVDDRLDVSVPSAAAGEQLADILQATLRRSRDGLAERLSDIAHWDENLVADIRQTVLAKLDELRRRLAKSNTSRVPVVLRPESNLQLFRRLDRMGNGLLRACGRFVAWLRRKIGESRLAVWRDRLGLPDLEPHASVDGTQWAAPVRPFDVPVFYSRLFGTQARWAGDVLDVPEDEVRRARAALFSSAVAPKMVALIGPDSASRGALAGAVLRGSKAPRRLAFTQPTSTEELEAALSDVGTAQLVHVSGLAWLVAARPDGFHPLERLLEFVLKEDRRSAWLVEVDEPVWRFAASATALSDVFSTQICLPALTSRGLERAILARHELSGYGLQFKLGEATEPLVEDRGPLRDRFFQALFEASGGLLQVALPLWLGSIGRVAEDAEIVEISEEPSVPLKALRRLPEKVWMELYAVARQGWIDAASLAFTLQIEVTAAEGRLVGLAGLGLLEKQARGVFVIRRHLRGAIMAGLRGAGWLS